MSLHITDATEGQLQVHLTTKQKQYAVPDVPYSIRANVDSKDLNTLLGTLLKDSGKENAAKIKFDFLLNGEFVKTSLSQHLKERDISFEDSIELEYVERYPAPEPQDCLLHDDWVSAVQAKDGWILTGTYDNTVNLWNTKGKHKLTIPGHVAPVKGVAWISLNEHTGVFASASHDQTVMIWEWNVTTNSVECVHVCKGHERGVGCIAVNPSKTQMASGSMDTMLKIWSTELHNNKGEPSATKKAKLEQDNVRTPVITLAGHREFVSGVQWIDNTTVATCSWDHTIKLWDLTLGGIKTEFTGNKSFFDLSYSPLNGMIITASPDKNLRLYDPRSKHGNFVKNTFLGHTQWVQSCRWSTTNEYLFVSGAYDNRVKMWDYRSPKAPIFELIGHEDKVLACDWSNPMYILSGGSDNALRVFKSKIAVNNETDD